MPSVGQKIIKNRKKGAGPKEWLASLTKIISSPTELKKLVTDLLFNPDYSFYVMLILLPIELILNLLIVYKIKCNIYAFYYVELWGLNY